MALRPPQFFKRYFREKEIDEAVNDDRILTLSIKLPVGCNLKCKYCYGGGKIGDLKIEDILSAVKSAVALGIKSVSILGEGEPMMYKDGNRDIFCLVDEINRFNMPAIIFTNNTHIDKAKAKELFKRNTFIVAKLNSLDIDTQKRLSGEKHAHKIFEGLAILKETGFNKVFPSRLAIHSVIVKDNYDEICAMWGMCRSQNIIPYFQVFVPPRQGSKNKKYINQLYVPKEKIRKLFFKLNAIDKNKFGLRWNPDYTYPIPALGCKVIKSGCAIDSFGNVKFCAYLDENLGNIRREPLKAILSKREVRKIRRFKYYRIKQNRHFYGCRTMAFNMTQDRYSNDPFFWRE